MSRNPWLKAGYVKTAGHTFVPQGQSGTGIMVCYAPPKHVVDSLVMDDPDAEPAHDLHVTLAYLGKTTEYKPQHLKDLPEVVDAWAEGQKPHDLAVQGSGTFLASEPGQAHVLHALVNSSGLHRRQAQLVDHLKKYGYNPREEHGYIPHITLGYVRHQVRFLPKVTRLAWTANDVWSAVGGERRRHPFGSVH